MPGQAAGSGRFRAMGVGELLDAIFSLYRRNFLLIAAISAVVQVPYALVRLGLLSLVGFSTFSGRSTTFPVQPSGSSQALTPAQVQGLVGFLAVTFGLALVNLFVVTPLAEAATTRTVSDRYLDTEASLGRAYAAAWRRLRSLVAASLILFGGAVALVLAAGLLTFVLSLAGIAGVVVAVAADVALLVLAIAVEVRVSLAVPSIVLETLSGWRGLRRSWGLVRGSSWRIFGIFLLLGLITSIISGILTTLLALAGAGLDVTGQAVVQQVASAIVAVFIAPVTYIAVTLLYYDLRIRREGFDIEMLARSL